ncbi:MAG: UDP-N-acetylglucosamine 2-epimerase (non-hydrolyzing) [Actinomycetia bacterium]|nr:UDP-N-acetylglucosamine 2-epimerase (non-hydrolyzing) [Actinomycetes bacterium]
MKSERVAVVVGTRPEIIKLAPVIHSLGGRALVVHTGQHFDDNMSRSFLDQLRLGQPDLHLAIGGETRGAQIGMATQAIEAFLLDAQPAAIVVQGDTNSGVAGALAANSARIPLVHVEAGMRSYDRAMPEEHNRVLIDVLADMCLVPHETNAAALRHEGIAESRIRVTGSTLRDAIDIIMPTPTERTELIAARGVETNRFVLATIHRAENADSDANLGAILRELAAIPLPVVLPLHPRTRGRALEFGLDDELAALQVCEPIGYREFISLASEAALLVSDSGGVQEEACIVKRPVVIVRNSTERPEILGTFAHLVAAGSAIGDKVRELLERLPAVHEQLAALPYPYGDHAAEKVVQAIDELSARA